MAVDSVDTDEAGPATRSPLRGPSLALVVGAGAVLWGWWLGTAPLSDNSFFTHLATGRLIVDDGIPRHDVYSFTAEGADWVVQSWLASWIYASVESAWGAWGLRVLTGALTAAVAGLVWTLTRPAGSLVGRVAVTTLAIAVAPLYWAERPLLFGLVLLGVVWLTIDGRLPAWVLVPVMWLWVNVHGSYPLGLVLVGCVLAGRAVERAREVHDTRVAVLAVVGTLLGAINPLGPRLLAFPAELLSRSDLLRVVVEWQSPAFDNNSDRFFLALIALAAAGLVRARRWSDFAVFAVFVPAALLGARNVPIAALAITPVAARALGGLGTLKGRERGVTATAGFVAVIAVMALVGSDRRAEPDFQLASYPVRALAVQRASGPDGPLVTADIAGNFIELLDGRSADVFLDDRFDMFPPEVVRDYVSLLEGDPRSLDLLEDYRARSVIWRVEDPLSGLLRASEQWQLVFVDQRWAYFERR